jgi:hypothetical protein
MNVILWTVFANAYFKIESGAFLLSHVTEMSL